MTKASPWQHCHEVHTKLSGWLTEYSCLALLLLSIELSAKIIGKSYTTDVKIPKTLSMELEEWSWFLIIALFYSERTQHAEKRVVLYLRKRLFGKVGQLSKLKSQGEFANTTITRHSYKEKYQELLRPKRPPPIEASCKKTKNPKKQCLCKFKAPWHSGSGVNLAKMPPSSNTIKNQIILLYLWTLHLRPDRIPGFSYKLHAAWQQVGKNHVMNNLDPKIRI